MSKVGDEETEIKRNMMHRKRKCRDILCIPLFMIYWFGMGLVFYISLINGNPSRLIYASDFEGNICGTTNSENKFKYCYNDNDCGKYLVYPKLDEDLFGANLAGLLADPLSLATYPFHGICRNTCPEGNVDINNDGEIDDWICDYDQMKELNTLYDVNTNNIEIPSNRARIALEECLVEKSTVPFLSGLNSLPRNKLLTSGDRADCLKLMTNCRKMYVPEKSVLFRCVAVAAETSTCINSPYLVAMNESISYYIENNEQKPRLSTHPLCGECLEPRLDPNGIPMDPSAPECRSRQVFANVEKIDAQINPILGSLNSLASQFQGWLGDIYNGVPYILTTGVVAPFVMGIIWLIFLRVAAKLFVFSVLYGILLLLTFLSLQMLIYGEVIQTKALNDIINEFSNATGFNIDISSISSTFGELDSGSTQVYATIGYLLSGVTVLYLFLLFLMNRRIKIAVALIKEATIAVSAMPTILFFPVCTVTFTVVIGCYWAYVLLYFISIDTLQKANLTEIIQIDAENNSTQVFLAARSIVASYEQDLMNLQPSLEEDIQNSLNIFNNHLINLPFKEIFFVYHLMGYLWTNQLIQAVGATTVAGAIGSWYWSTSEEGKKNKNMPRRPIIKSFYRVFRYHLGSLLFGSFIIALVQLIRTLLMYLDKQTQTLQKTNTIIKILMKSIQCCLCVLEKILKFITRNAFIYIALFGNSFCTSTREVFKLMVLNFARIGIATAISSLVILLGKILIVTASAFLCVSLHSIAENNVTIQQVLAKLSLTQTFLQPTSIVPPLLVTILVSWFVSSCFLSIYGLTIDTLLVSLCVDEEKNDGSPEKPYFMTKSLLKITRKVNKKVKSFGGSDKGSNSSSSKESSTK